MHVQQINDYPIHTQTILIWIYIFNSSVYRQFGFAFRLRKLSFVDGIQYLVWFVSIPSQLYVNLKNYTWKCLTTFYADISALCCCLSTQKGSFFVHFKIERYFFFSPLAINHPLMILFEWEQMHMCLSCIWLKLHSIFIHPHNTQFKHQIISWWYNTCFWPNNN